MLLREVGIGLEGEEGGGSGMGMSTDLSFKGNQRCES